MEEWVGRQWHRFITRAADGRASHAPVRLEEMQRTGAHLARVVDESRQVAGVVFLEDVLEELVGEVHDATRRAF